MVLEMTRFMPFVRRIFLVLLVTAVLVEIALQAISFFVYRAHSPDSIDIDEAGGPRIMCVGDSFTFGSGASGPRFNYPAAMEQILRDRRGADFHVANYGWPGQNSSDVLAKLEEQLDRTKPSVTCVLVGVNDAWSRPRLLDAGETGAGTPRFRITWRTGRILKLLFQPRDRWATNDPEPSAAAGPDSGGRLIFDPERDTAIMMEMLRDAGLSPGSRTPRKINRSRAIGAVLSAAEAMDSQGERRSFLLENLDRNGRHPMLLEHLVLIDVRIGQQEEAIELTNELLQRADVEPEDPVIAGSLVRSLTVTGQWEKLRAEAGRLSKLHPDVTAVWLGLARSCFPEKKHHHLSLSAYRKVIELNPDAGGKRLVFKRLVKLLSETDSSAAALVAAAGYVTADEAPTAFSSWMRTLDADFVQSLAGKYGRTEYSRERLSFMYEDLFGSHDADKHLVTFQAHLEGIVEMIRSHGGEPVIVSYPRATGKLVDVTREVAESTGAPFADCHSRFLKEMEHSEENELFVPDNHCNDAGYRIVAEVVADAVEEALELR